MNVSLEFSEFLTPSCVVGNKYGNYSETSKTFEMPLFHV